MKNSVWPPPVYEGTFADGSTLRMSFAQKAGKPIDFAAGDLERSSKPLRRPSLWPFAVALALFALAVVRW